MFYRFSADRLIELRTSRGWSRETLAGAAGISYASLYAYENGRRTPGVAALYALAAVLDVDPRDLIAEPSAVTP